MCDQQSLRSACAYVQSDKSLCYSLEYSMIVKLLTEQHSGFLNLKGGCIGSSESTLVKIPRCWKSHATALFFHSYFSIHRCNAEGGYTVHLRSLGRPCVHLHRFCLHYWNKHTEVGSYSREIGERQPYCCRPEHRH